MLVLILDSLVLGLTVLPWQLFIVGFGIHRFSRKFVINCSRPCCLLQTPVRKIWHGGFDHSILCSINSILLIGVFHQRCAVILLP